MPLPHLRTCLHLLLNLGCAIALLWSMPAAAAPAKREVLVLYSLGSDTSSLWQRQLARGMAQELSGGQGADAPEVFDERLNVVRTGADPGMAAMVPYLRAKYAAISLDAVVAENFHASQFLAAHPELFPGVPRFYVNHGRRGWKPTDGVGLEIVFDYARAIGAIALAMPAVSRIVVVGDPSPRGQEWLDAVRALAPSYQGRIAFEFWDHQSFAQLYQQAAQLGPDTAIYMFPTYFDSLGAPGQPAQVARTLAARASVPVFTYVDSLIVPGIAGGYVISGERVGRAIGRIVAGKPAALADVQDYVFDYQVANRFGLRAINGATWLNRQPSMWDQYRWQIIGAVSLMLLEAALITALVLALRARRASIGALDEERGRLEQRVAQRTLELQAANQALEQQVSTDALTGIGNRRRMTALISAELERARRFRHRLSLLMIDIDNFKAINDCVGHDAGDRALVAVAMTLAADLRGSDAAARFGGEEFVVLMPQTGLALARDAAERLRAAVAALRLSGDQDQPISLTISVGVAAYDPHGVADTPTTLLSRADRALYRAKENGRNLVECAEDQQ